MKMTLADYIRNPMGRSNAVFNATARESIRAAYKQKFDMILLREHNKINYTLYYGKNNKYFAYFKIPSETVEKFYYDVVIEFYADEDVKQGGSDLSSYNVKFFSNDPSFNYTYAYVFLHNGLAIEELKSKMSKKAINKDPKETNSSGAIGYVKTIYFAYLFMEARGLLKLVRFKGEAVPLNITNLRNSIEDTDTKVFNREEEGRKLEAKKSKERKKEVSKEKRENNFATKVIGKISNIKTTKTTSVMKKTTAVRKSKKK